MKTLLPRKDIFGWYEDGGQTPAHDSGLDTICPFCCEQLRSQARCTISLMKTDSHRSYFYRAHEACYERATGADITDFESSLIDLPE